MSNNTLDNLCIHVSIEVRQEKGWSGEKPILARAVIEGICSVSDIAEVEQDLWNTVNAALNRAKLQLNKTMAVKRAEEQQRIALLKPADE